MGSNVYYTFIQKKQNKTNIILGAIILGCSRSIAAEFSFFLAIPVMFGVSILKIGDFILDKNVMLLSEFVLWFLFLP